MRTASCTVDEAHDGCPLWQVLAEQLGVSDRMLRRAKHAPKALLLDGVPARSTAPVRLGQTAEIAVDDKTIAPENRRVEPEAGPLAIVYEDDDVLVIDKPAGLVVHPCSGQRTGTLGNFVAHHLAATGRGEGLHPVHRLDQGTSGLMVFATSGYAQSRIQKQMEDGVFGRTYLALCHGVFACDRGAVDAPIGRISRGPRSFGVVSDTSPLGKRALTRYRVLETVRSAYGPLSLVKLTLETGRTHQIRVHMSHLGHPLLGDAAYAADGGRPPLFPRTALHSWRLALQQPLSGEELFFELPLPTDMAEALACLAPNGA